MNRILVTGAGGFVGRAAMAALGKTGAELHAVSRRSAGDAGGARWHTTDILDVEAIEGLMAAVRPTHLLHLAWNVEPGAYWTSPANLDWVRCSLALLQAFARHGGRRVVMAGSCAEYEWIDGVYSETGTPLNPATLYGVCKDSLQRMLHAGSGPLGLSAAWGRIFFPYGPREHPSRLIPSVVGALLAGQPAKCSSGEQVRDYIHVDDVASAFAALLMSDVNGPVNVGSGAGVAVKDIALRIGAKLGRPDLVRLGALPSPRGEPARMIADVGRLRGEVGWRPALDLDQGLDGTIAWWRERLNAAADKTRSAPC